MATRKLLLLVFLLAASTGFADAAAGEAGLSPQWQAVCSADAPCGGSCRCQGTQSSCSATCGAKELPYCTPNGVTICECSCDWSDVCGHGAR